MFRSIIFATFVLSVLNAPSAFAKVDGCALALCLAKGGPAVAECRPILKQFYKDTVLGEPPPRCKKMGGGPDASSSATDQQQANQANNVASVATNGTGQNAYSGTQAANNYNNAQDTSTTAVDSAQTMVNNGVRTVDANVDLQSDNGQQALSQSNTVASQANATVGNPGGSSDTSTSTGVNSEDIVNASLADVPSDIAKEAQNELEASSTNTNPSPNYTINTDLSEATCRAMAAKGLNCATGQPVNN